MWEDLEDRERKQNIVRTHKILREIRLPVGGAYKTRKGTAPDPADQVRPDSHERITL